jgi:hypothetical protein
VKRIGKKLRMRQRKSSLLLSKAWTKLLADKTPADLSRIIFLGTHPWPRLLQNFIAIDEPPVNRPVPMIPCHGSGRRER